MRKYVISDIHGSHKCLMECLYKCKFDYNNDTLIVNGDVCDGHEKSYEVIEELLKIKNLIFVIGNHDVKLLTYLTENKIPNNWLNIGGDKTIASYLEKDASKHIQFLKNAKSYHIEDDILFVHAGIHHKKLITKNSRRTMHSNRSFWRKAKQYEKQHLKFKLREFSKAPLIKEIVIGHSPVNIKNGVNFPLRYANVWNIDCGVANGGHLAIMDIHSKKYWLSSPH